MVVWLTGSDKKASDNATVQAILSCRRPAYNGKQSDNRRTCMSGVALDGSSFTTMIVRDWIL